jgi:hypothetical protein
MIPTFLINVTMETYFQNGNQPAGPSEQDNRLNPPAALLSTDGQAEVVKSGGNVFTDSTRINATESCVGCHFSAGVATRFKTNDDGTEQLFGRYPTAIFGENANGGDNGNANFSWMLQLEPQAKPRPVNAAQK